MLIDQDAEEYAISSVSTGSVAQAEVKPGINVFEIQTDKGNTKVWIDQLQGVPLKVETNYNGSQLVEEFCNIKIGEGVVGDNQFKIPENAIILNAN